MSELQPIAVDLPQQLIEQYKAALANVVDLRLVVLLAFSSFEEVMKSFLAWRLSCKVEQLPPFATRTSDNLFQLVLLDNKELYKQAKSFAEVRNQVAHKFHLDAYEPLLTRFVQSVTGDACPEDEPAKRKAIINAVFHLAINVAAAYLAQVPERAEFPFPSLSMELAEPDAWTSVSPT